jgi:2-polyprenyl-3-methyl-5-hydroxy-6-metoxy-1,4-benzoquinol methylase
MTMERSADHGRNIRAKVCCLLLVILSVGHIGHAQSRLEDAKIWNDFLVWVKKQPPVAAEALIPEYKSQLISDGLAESEADTQLEIIRRLAKERRLELVAIDFDKYYVGNTPNFSKEPNAFLAGVVARPKRGRALDVAMGQGRNAVFLAEKGWSVTGYDVAGEGLRIARERAAALGLEINTVQSTHEDFPYRENQWDLVVMTYFWAPNDRPEFVKRIRDSLKPDGLLIVEENDGSLPSGGAGKVLNPLLKWFEDFRILRYELSSSGGEWGNPNNTVYRLLAQKSQ